MKLFHRAKDGGPQSTVTGYWLAEIKSLFSVVLLKFEDGSRDMYHSHAFDSLNWVLKGRVVEFEKLGELHIRLREYVPSWRPVVTRRSTFHKVVSQGTTWVFSLRGPWSKSWQEWDPKTEKTSTLGNGRVVL